MEAYVEINEYGADVEINESMCILHFSFKVHCLH